MKVNLDKHRHDYMRKHKQKRYIVSEAHGAGILTQCKKKRIAVFYSLIKQTACGIAAVIGKMYVGCKIHLAACGSYTAVVVVVLAARQLRVEISDL